MNLPRVQAGTLGVTAAESAGAILSSGYLELLTYFKKDIAAGSGKAEAIAGGEHVVWKLNEWVWRLGVRPAEVYSWSRDGVALRLTGLSEKRQRAVAILNHLRNNTKELSTTGITPPKASLEYLYLCGGLRGPCDPAGEFGQVSELGELLKELRQRHLAADVDVAQLLQRFGQQWNYARQGKGAYAVTLERMSCLGPDLLDELDSLRHSYLSGEKGPEKKDRLRGILARVSGAIAGFVLFGSGKAAMPWRVSADSKPENFVTVPRAGAPTSFVLIDVDCFYHEGEGKRPDLCVPELFTLGKRLHVYPLPPELRKTENAAALVVMHFLVFVCNWLRERGCKSNLALRQDIFCEESCPGLGDQATIVRGLELLGQIDRHYQTARAERLTMIAGLTWTMQQHHPRFYTACCPVGTGRLYTCSYNYRLLLRLVTCARCHKQSAGGALLGALSKFYSAVVQQSELLQVASGWSLPPDDSWGAPYDPTEPEAGMAVLPDEGAVTPLPTALISKSALRVGDLLKPELILKLKPPFDAKAIQPQEDRNNTGINIQNIAGLLDQEIAKIEALLGKEIQQITEKETQNLAASIRKLYSCRRFALSAQAKESKQEAAQVIQESLQCIAIQQTIDTKLAAWEANAKWQEALCREPFALYGLYLLFQSLRRVPRQNEQPNLYQHWRARAERALCDLSRHILPMQSLLCLLRPYASARSYLSTDALQELFQTSRRFAKRGETNKNDKSIFFTDDKLCRLLSTSMRTIKDLVTGQISRQGSSQRLLVTRDCSGLPACIQPHYKALQLMWRIAADPQLVAQYAPDLLWTNYSTQNKHDKSLACLDCLYEQAHQQPNSSRTVYANSKLLPLDECTCAAAAEKGTLKLKDLNGPCVHALFLQAFLCTIFVQVCEELPPPTENSPASKTAAMHELRRVEAIRPKYN